MGALPFAPVYESSSASDTGEDMKPGKTRANADMRSQRLRSSTSLSLAGFWVTAKVG